MTCVHGCCSVAQNTMYIQVICDGYECAGYTEMRTIETVLVNGENPLRGSTIVSENDSKRILTVSINGTFSLSDTTDIYCNETDTCRIDCQSKDACLYVNLFCFGRCLVSCDDNSTDIICPTVIHGNYSFEWIGITSIPTMIPTAIPTTMPTAQPTVTPTEQPQQPTSLPTEEPTKQPSEQPTESTTIATTSRIDTTSRSIQVSSSSMAPIGTNVTGLGQSENKNDNFGLLTVEQMLIISLAGIVIFLIIMVFCIMFVFKKGGKGRMNDTALALELRSASGFGSNSTNTHNGAGQNGTNNIDNLNVQIPRPQTHNTAGNLQDGNKGSTLAKVSSVSASPRDGQIPTKGGTMGFDFEDDYSENDDDQNDAIGGTRGGGGLGNTRGAACDAKRVTLKGDENDHDIEALYAKAEDIEGAELGVTQGATDDHEYKQQHTEGEETSL